MSYVDALYDRSADIIRVAERVDGERIDRTFPVEHVFYYADKTGKERTIFGDRCSKFSTPRSAVFHKKLRWHRDSGHAIFESDINPVFRSLARHYPNAATPTLNIGFFDIEVAFDPARGFAPTDKPFNEVTAITLHGSHDQRLVTLVLKPPTLSYQQAADIADKFTDTAVFEHEADLLLTFLDLIDDIDVLSGWNSEGFDIPYLVNRMKQVLGVDAICRFCLWGKEPREREYVKFMRSFKTYELVGRVHLDYLLLYQKHNTQQQHSYRLDFIGEIEVGEKKTPYEGTLDTLYKQDFERFIAYNRQDVLLLVKIDKKRKFIELSNQVAHANCVLLKTTMGSVSLVETAIINEMHAMGVVVPDRKPKDDGSVVATEAVIDVATSSFDEDDTSPGSAPEVPSGRQPGDAAGKAVGAYVAKPKTGLRREIGCCDINSLYPSAIRALNMSPETIVGQVRHNHTETLLAKRLAAGVKPADLWEGLFATAEVSAMHEGNASLVVTVDFEDGRSVQMTAAALGDYVYDPENHVCITANGTLFRTDVDGIIPALLAKWYAERKELQAKAKYYTGLAYGVDVPAEMSVLLDEGRE